jgi:hypothetical protein
MNNHIVLRVLARAVVVITAILFAIPAFWQLLWATAETTVRFLLAWPTPLAFNLMLAAMIGTLVLGWPLAVLRGGYLGLKNPA